MQHPHPTLAAPLSASLETLSRAIIPPLSTVGDSRGCEPIRFHVEREEHCQIEGGARGWEIANILAGWRIVVAECGLNEVAFPPPKKRWDMLSFFHNLLTLSLKGIVALLQYLGFLFGQSQLSLKCLLGYELYGGVCILLKLTVLPPHPKSHFNNQDDAYRCKTSAQYII